MCVCLQVTDTLIPLSGNYRNKSVIFPFLSASIATHALYSLAVCSPADVIKVGMSNFFLVMSPN